MRIPVPAWVRRLVWRGVFGDYRERAMHARLRCLPASPQFALAQHRMSVLNVAAAYDRSKDVPPSCGVLFQLQRPDGAASHLRFIFGHTVPPVTWGFVLRFVLAARLPVCDVNGVLFQSGGRWVTSPLKQKYEEGLKEAHEYCRQLLAFPLEEIRGR